MWQIQKNAEKHDNNVAFAMRPCGKPIVLTNSEIAHKGLKPLVIKKVNEF